MPEPTECAIDCMSEPLEPAQRVSMWRTIRLGLLYMHFVIDAVLRCCVMHCGDALPHVNEFEEFNEILSVRQPLISEFAAV